MKMGNAKKDKLNNFLMKIQTEDHKSKTSDWKLAKNPPAMGETWVRALGLEDLLEKREVTHPSILTWRIPWTI